MRTLFGLTMLLAVPALAHIKLEGPLSFQVTDSLGNPQKTGPCGEAGTASGVVTTVTAGSTLTVTWKETILHPGHFRLGIARMPSEFMTPVPVLNNNGTNCASAPIQSTPSYPILVDGLFQHSSAAPANTYTTTVTVPMMSCDNCMLQLMQFMSAHSPPCFYYQCAALKIVMPDAGGPAPTDAGTDAGTNRPAMDAGPTGGGGGSSASCSAANCQGCCSADGTCLPGTLDATCGAGGQLCLLCSADTTCLAGQCAATPTGCGCGVAPFGLLVLVPFAFMRRRRR